MGLMVPGTARAATTYTIQFGAEFGRLPAFSLRVYPSYVKVTKGDTLHFTGFGGMSLLPKNVHPADFNEDNAIFLGDRWLELRPDPDDGPRATKFNPLFFDSAPCGSSPTTACEFDGSGNDPLLPGWNEDGETWVEIDANPGDVLWGWVGRGRSPLRIEVVPNAANASTQAELDARADELLAKDFETAWSTHNAYLNRRSSHKDASGRKVHDAWAGLTRGPIEFFAMYPSKLKVKKGDRVMWHFAYDSGSPHNVVTPLKTAFQEINSFFPQCDPDGDAGPGPDTMPNFEAENPADWCPQGSELEFDMDEKEIWGTGNGVFNGKDNDLESSGVRLAETYKDGPFSNDPYMLKFAAKSGKKGYKYVCTIHGRFMSGKVVVR